MFNIKFIVLGFAMEHVTGVNQNIKKYQSTHAQLVVLPQLLLELHQSSMY